MSTTTIEQQVAANHDAFTGYRVALYDLDGVICDDRHRQHFALSRDWGEYFAGMVEDTVWAPGRELYDNAALTGWHVAYLTGRREDTRPWTVDWLHRHGFDATAPLLMRPQEDRRALAEVKAAAVTALVGVAAEVILYDDDPDVIARVQRVPGARAVHCGWHVKPKRLVASGRA